MFHDRILNTVDKISCYIREHYFSIFNYPLELKDLSTDRIRNIFHIHYFQDLILRNEGTGD